MRCQGEFSGVEFGLVISVVESDSILKEWMKKLLGLWIRTDRESQVRQSLGFCTADFWPALAYESAEPKYCLTWDFLSALVRIKSFSKTRLTHLRRNLKLSEGEWGEIRVAESEAVHDEFYASCVVSLVNFETFDYLPSSSTSIIQFPFDNRRHLFTYLTFRCACAVRALRNYLIGQLSYFWSTLPTYGIYFSFFWQFFVSLLVVFW